MRGKCSYVGFQVSGFMNETKCKNLENSSLTEEALRGLRDQRGIQRFCPPLTPIWKGRQSCPEQSKVGEMKGFGRELIATEVLSPGECGLQRKWPFAWPSGQGREAPMAKGGAES